MANQYFYQGAPLEMVQKFECGDGHCTFLVKDLKNQYICKQFDTLPGEANSAKLARFTHEIESYERLRETKISIPELLEANYEHCYLIKEHIDGELISDLVSCGAMTTEIFMKAFEFSEDLKAHDINLDYFPSNFVVKNDEIFYIDYELNAYIDEWDFTHWGIYYWLNQEGMKLFNDMKSLDLLHSSMESTRPRTLGFEHTVAELKALYQHSFSQK